MRRTSRRYAAGLALAAATLALAITVPAAGATTAGQAVDSRSAECDPASGARVRDGSSASEPKL